MKLHVLDGGNQRLLGLKPTIGGDSLTKTIVPKTKALNHNFSMGNDPCNKYTVSHFG